MDALQGTSRTAVLRVILIGGTSHVGKSTLAGSLAARLGWPVTSTDQLGRHPGRPWPEVRPHVAEHYLKLSPAAIYEFLLVHHENLWPRVRGLIDRHTRDRDAGPLILEGSALRPELVAGLAGAGVETAWLTASPDLIRRRIVDDSGFERAPAETRRMIQAFIDRSLTDGERIGEAARRLDLRCIDAARQADVERFRDAMERGAGRSRNG